MNKFKFDELKENFKRFLNEDTDSFLKSESNNENAEAEFHKLMKGYDWYFEMSDDHRYWVAGKELNRKLYNLAKIIGQDKAVEIFNQYAPKGEDPRTITSMDDLE